MHPGRTALLVVDLQNDFMPGGERGGPWPPHCVAGTIGAAFSAALDVIRDAIVVSKATTRDAEAYLEFEGTGLRQLLRAAHGDEVMLGGLATDYCVPATTSRRRMRPSR